MIIDFQQAQLQKFMALAMKIEAQPELYVQFDSVSDFYKADWLQDFPNGTTWYVSGLDDGADEFHVVIDYATAQLQISCGQTQLSAKLSCTD
ncbi:MULTISPECIES: hypothetical protein [Acinetobacter]|jgi:hypothetical protein|uniref:Uncharacterized protein n=1 Tax=Acinetobacter pseudolwoffii TaxID=2053287 RepID=N9KTI1_9GAMM|nr:MULTISPECIES: hypothetical protein [Acinetobacter]ENW23861.1 hypothetical protein F925_02829 [Acinetobacter lwoffii NCTC 5866 = CIP 64.10 = NIPH 512]ENW87357.1 hypothetical protein F906_00590 [Acinetobacter pseudolwoffii]MDH5819823.1 hypothetical protein [Acinetobacter pseudolwoffii]MDM1323062.1 hypothetical protein [Acinetobacter pseudolwoffii]MDM1341053.1 hypothetical protein [Acinetobacter pseudolwoffii]